MEQKENLPIQELSGNEYHIQALEANEDGNFLGALENTDRALLKYQSEGDTRNFAEVFAMRSLIFRRLFKETEDENFLIAAKHEVEAGIEIGRKSGDESSLAIPLYNLGKVYFELGKFEKASEIYQESLDMLPKSPQNRPSVVADITANLEIAKLCNGDLSSEGNVVTAISDIERSDASPHEKGVWISGNYMKLAEALYSHNPSQSQNYLSKAREIIEKNPDDLKLVKGDLERLEKKLQ